ncbi:YHS domain-containing (seleno)protein [Fulvivirgaceae bacterium BMA10]|uniref:YHS domain-containing (Seleno)protein n=1 Tax=Splendidivirga corallicola TaxID=3051826 RepID=A0ABT8KUP2_9BACT|nr:YHS domain-containing (seleno)protein [Fulvivirgaceae bacterium BMA10]
MKNKKTKKMLTIIAGVFAVLIVGIIVFAKVKKVYPLSLGFHSSVNTSSKVAIQGYDPVAYHQSGSAEKGSEQFAYEWKGANWQFASAENLNLFKTDPEKFAPQFGGYCAFAVSKGFTANTNPGVWQIENGKLYLFDSEDMKKNWMKSLSEGVIEKSQSNWK